MIQRSVRLFEQRFIGGILLLNGAADAMFALRDELYPPEEGEIYPDCVSNALVNIPANR